jgi:2-polyprenyl-3-methyl-5-hydroxy-6-metoxy-1,4-benzoquinol methylase
MICTICNSTEFTKTYRFNDKHYFVCKGCHSAVFSPVPSENEIDEFYRNYVTYKSGLTEYMTESSYPGFISNLEYTLNDLGLPFQDRSINLVDIGSGNGFFLKYLLEKYPKIIAEGVDLSKQCVESCLKRGLNVKIGDVFSLIPEKKYDFITLFHVIEHVKNPIEWIKRINQQLVTGGYFIIETPVYGIIAESFAESWRYFMPVEHLNLFSKNALLDLLKNYGFEIINHITYGSGNNAPDINPSNKRAMDRFAKLTGNGDTLAIYAKKK